MNEYEVEFIAHVRFRIQAKNPSEAISLAQAREHDYDITAINVIKVNQFSARAQPEES